MDFVNYLLVKRKMDNTKQASAKHCSQDGRGVWKRGEKLVLLDGIGGWSVVDHCGLAKAISKCVFLLNSLTVREPTKYIGLKVVLFHSTKNSTS